LNIHRLSGRYAVIGCKKNNANEGCNSLAGLLLQLLVVAAIILSFIACFTLLVIGALNQQPKLSNQSAVGCKTECASGPGV